MALAALTIRCAGLCVSVCLLGAAHPQSAIRENGASVPSAVQRNGLWPSIDLVQWPACPLHQSASDIVELLTH
jgi:hypothetical protein